MPKPYSKQRINFDTATDADLPRQEYHRTLRSAIALSATSFSQQKANDGATYQWDNIAPEIALVILQDAQKQGLNIQDEVVAEIGIEAFNQECLHRVLEKLHSNPNYSLFIQKLALHISDRKSKELTLETLQLAGITSVDQFDKVFTHFLYAQKTLANSIPNFSSINDEDDFNQFIVFLANDPLYDSFLQSFTQNLASEYNKNRESTKQIEVPKEINSKSLLSFFQAISYSLSLTVPDSESLKTNTLHVALLYGKLQYTLIDPSGKPITDTIDYSELNKTIDEHTSEEVLKSHLPEILHITSQKGHTTELALNTTKSLRDKSLSFLDSDVGARLFLSHLPAVDLVKDEGYKFALYQWLNQGNLARLTGFLTVSACQRYNDELDTWIKQTTEPSEIDRDFEQEIDAVGTLMKEVTELVAALDDDPSAKDQDLDEKITQLINHLSHIKELYSSTPLLKPGADYPSTEGNFEEFIKKVIFNSADKKLIQYITDSKENGTTLELNLVNLIVGIAASRNHVEVRNANNLQEYSFLTDKMGLAVSPAIVLREQLKSIITTKLKNDIHHYHTLRSYENDKLKMTKAPVVFRSGFLTDSFEQTKLFAKKMLQTGEYSADSHLLAGQENNSKKHEIRSGTAASIADTDIRSTRTVTDKLDIALRFGGMKDVKILYIARGKEAIDTQPFAEMVRKPKSGEIAHTHLNPNDYIMTILYDHNNVILDVIPGNLNCEIDGVSELSKKVIAAGIEFYNNKHNTTLGNKPQVTLPNPEAPKKTIIHASAHEPLLDVLHVHKKESSISPLSSKLDSIRISKSTRAGHKSLTLQTLRPDLEAVHPLSGGLDLPEGSFKKTPGRLDDVRETALAHFNMRHVLTLKGFIRWDHRERRLQETYNRILQPNFMEGELESQLQHANIAHEEWLTDVLVPKMQTALMLHIATRLITDYKVDVEEVNELAQKLYHTLIHSSKNSAQIHGDWLTLGEKVNEPSELQACIKKAEDKMAKLYPTLNKDSYEYDRRFPSCLIMEKNKVRKRLANQMMSEFLDKCLDQYTEELSLEKKTVHPLQDNRDFVFLGPAASGKSTISNQYIKKEERKDYVSLATDDYRGIFMPYTDAFEKQETEQVFIRTQDSAYLVSELVEERMQAQKRARPNLIVDGVTYKATQRALVEQNNNSIIVCACLDDISQVVKRSYDRAKQEDSCSADKGRYVNTTDLINMHKTASLNLIIYCAPNTTIALYNTNVPFRSIPPLIATIDTHGEKTLSINHEKGSLMTLASFFNKARVNVGAKRDEHLFLSKLKQPEFQIDSLFAVMDYGFKIKLNGDDGKPFLTVKKESNGQIVMEILDVEQVKTKLQENITEKPLLQMLLLYGKHGSLKAVQQECLLHDDIDIIVDHVLDSQTVQEKVAGDSFKISS